MGGFCLLRFACAACERVTMSKKVVRVKGAIREITGPRKDICMSAEEFEALFVEHPFFDNQALDLQEAINKHTTENTKRLASCPGPHVFSLVKKAKRDGVDLANVLGPWQCAKCSGRLHDYVRCWYEKGVAHGKESTGEE